MCLTGYLKKSLYVFSIFIVRILFKGVILNKTPILRHFLSYPHINIPKVNLTRLETLKMLLAEVIYSLVSLYLCLAYKIVFRGVYICYLFVSLFCIYIY